MGRNVLNLENMDHKKFLMLVQRMRAAQRLYFKSRSRAVLQECKELESAVDKTIADSVEPMQPTIFNQQENNA